MEVAGMNTFPPQPPDTPRRLRLHLLQWIGVPIIIVLPVLALLGVFGREESLVRASSGDLMLEVHYNSRLRYKQSNPLLVTVTNVSARPLDNITVGCDSAYFSMYDNLKFIPEARNPYIIPVGTLASGEQFRIRIDGQPEGKGHSTGYITVYTNNGVATSVALETFVFP
jgi:hypothetical protein